MREVYDSAEYNKLIKEVVTSWNFVITYIGVARYAVPPYEKKWYAWPDDFDAPIWKIRRDKYDTSRLIHDYSYPNLDTDFKYVWNKRSEYDYDHKPIPVPPTPTVDMVILLENNDYLITENWSYIWLE